MKDRLDQFIIAENITRTQFADSINVARAGISHIMAGRNKPSYEFIVNTMEVYPALNIEWLLTGKGTMYKDGSGPGETNHSDLFSINETQPQAQAPVQELASASTPPSSNSPISKIVVFFNDNTYKEFY